VNIQGTFRELAGFPPLKTVHRVHLTGRMKGRFREDYLLGRIIH
jgi:hypothetical protein